jgi:hypothetical protein
MKRIIILCAITAFALIQACSTTPICAVSSVVPLEGKTVAENLGKTRGTDSAVSVLGLYMIGRPDIDSAVKDAVKDKNADTLINVRCYEKSSYFVLFSITTVIVEGEAVTFTQEKNTQVKGGSR